MSSVRRLNLTCINQRCRQEVEEGVLSKPALGIREAVDLLEELLVEFCDVNRHQSLSSCQGFVQCTHRRCEGLALGQ